MFIRKKKKINPSTGKEYSVYQLVESVRTDRGPRQRILLSLSPELDLPEEQHKDLANRIEEIFTGAHSLFQYPEKVESMAQAYASQLINHVSSIEPSKHEADYQTIDLETIEQQEARTVGNEHLLLKMAEQLKLPEKLKELGLTQRDIALSLATIFGRAISPSSERASYIWFTKNSGLGEVIDFDFTTSSLDHLYKISDTLLLHKDALEKHLREAQACLHGYQSTMVLYDLTNTYIEGQAKSNSKAARGYSKEKRMDCPLVTLGLVVNEHGFPARSSILPGNVAESSTLEKMIQSLESADDLFKPIIVLDAGIATEENLDWLRAHHYKYVVSARQQAPSLALVGELISVDDDSKGQIKVALIKDEEDGERWLYCESKAKEAVASKMKIFFQERFEADLRKMAEGLLKPRGRKKYGKILERIGRLKERHNRISACYEITVQRSPDGEEATEILWKVLPEKMESKLKGHYFLRTNLTDIEPIALWKLYNSIRTVEDAFRFMKSDLGMRPVYHQKEERVDGHLWITLLAYHLIKSCLYQLEKAGVFHHWETIRNLMSSRVRVTMRAKTEKGGVIYHRSTTKAEEHHQKIYAALNLKTQVLKAKKFIG